MIIPNAKLKIFISSICGVDKYDKLRKKLKNAIEETQLADVYIFEEEGASTISARNHYRWSLQDSDLCIFLIDNEDGISPGVQEEINTVNKYNIKALYYFCDATNKEKTILEKNLEGAHNAKKKTVHSFDELYQIVKATLFTSKHVKNSAQQGQALAKINVWKNDPNFAEWSEYLDLLTNAIEIDDIQNYKPIKKAKSPKELSDAIPMRYLQKVAEVVAKIESEPTDIILTEELS